MCSQGCRIYKVRKTQFLQGKMCLDKRARSQPRGGVEAAVADVRAGLTDRGGLVVRFSAMGFYMFGRKA